jgi:hypothetical protein
VHAGYQRLVREAVDDRHQVVGQQNDFRHDQRPDGGVHDRPGLYAKLLLHQGPHDCQQVKRREEVEERRDRLHQFMPEASAGIAHHVSPGQSPWPGVYQIGEV